MKLTELIVPNGDIIWNNEQPPVSTTSKTTGNVTINNVGSPGRPGYFKVSFSMQADFEHEGVEASLWFTPTIPVTNMDKDSTVLQIEDLALTALPILLREIADDCERQISALFVKDEEGESVDKADDATAT